jgi:8-oxo-dGTP pyrophosphatase MutT (NUDIX family)
MQRIESETVYDGRLTDVLRVMFRTADGEEVEREVVSHPDAVGIVVHDDRVVYLVRQPREAVGEDALLEIPAGKLDIDGESPLETAQRELAEEIGKSAERWTELKRFYTTPGWADEQVTLFLATGLSDAEAEAEDSERIEIVEWPLGDLDEAIDQCADGKSLVGLLMLRQRLRSERA